MLLVIIDRHGYVIGYQLFRLQWWMWHGLVRLQCLMGLDCMRLRRLFRLLWFSQWYKTICLFMLCLLMQLDWLSIVLLCWYCVTELVCLCVFELCCLGLVMCLYFVVQEQLLIVLIPIPSRVCQSWHSCGARVRASAPRRVVCVCGCVSLCLFINK